MNGGVPGYVGGGGCSGSGVIDSTDVAAVEADAGAVVEHLFVGRVERIQEKGDVRMGVERWVGGDCEGCKGGREVVEW